MAAGELPPDVAPRIVKPRQPSHTHRPIIAVTRGEVLYEPTGETFAAATLPALLAVAPSSIIVCQGFGPHLKLLIDEVGDQPRFNYRVTPRYHESKRVNGEQRQTRVYDTVVNFVGWRKWNKKVDPPAATAQRVARYHYPLDPVHFIRKGIDELDPSDDARLVKLLRWAQEVRAWCATQMIEVKPSSGGLVAQLLKDPRFYPNPRRKCPQLINDTARSQLPGNYYQLHAERDRRYHAIYLDQSNAHHFAARQIAFPDVNHLRAYGHWRVQRDASRTFAAGDSALLHRPGLYQLRLSIPAMAANRFVPPFLGRSGIRNVWCYSNELELIKEHGATILGVICALVSSETETGMNAYAKFALDEIARRPDLKPWLKPTLHSTYGILAARPTPFETGFFRAAGGSPKDYPMGPVSIPARARRSKRPVESRLANVIHRGMIEAQVRKESLWFARYLTETDHRRVLAVYADSVFVLDDQRPIGLLPPPWRVSEHCTGLQFHSATHFDSRELTRLPGISRTLADDARLDRVARGDAVVSSWAQRKPRSQEDHQHGEQRRSQSQGPRGRVGRKVRQPDGGADPRPVR